MKKSTPRVKKPTLKVVAGDISRVKADALITAINSGGMWFGGIDGVIHRASGNLFHLQAAKAMPLKDGQTVVACSSGRAHDGAFTNVVFVVDELERPLHEVVCNGLKAASDAGFKSVTLPTIRMGVMLGVVEKSRGEAVREMAKGVAKFCHENPKNLLSITFVVYNDEELQRDLEEVMR